MKTIQAYEFKDLSPAVQETVRTRELVKETEYQIAAVRNALQSGEIDERGYYEALGCIEEVLKPDQIANAYYERNQEVIDENVRQQVAVMLYNKYGTVIGYLDEQA